MGKIQKKTHVLIIGVSKDIGGVENVVKNLYDNIDKNKFKLDFLVFAEKCAFEDHFILNESKVHHIISRRKNIFKHRIQLKAFFKENNKYDYIWINLSSASNILVYKYAKKYTKAKIVSHSHSTNIESNDIVFGLIYKYLHFKNKCNLSKLTDYYLACSEAAGIWLYSKKNKDNLIVINNGIDVDKYKFNLESRNEIRKIMKLDDKFVIGHIGRFTYVKNHSYLIDVFKEIKLLDSNAVLLLIGEGECKPEIEQKVQELGLTKDVIFMGFRKDIPSLLSAMDCLLLPSYFEGSPLTVIEALANGLNCVVSSNVKENFNDSPLVKFLPINVKPSDWANLVVNMKNVENREEYINYIRNSNYDIKISAKKITSLMK